MVDALFLGIAVLTIVSAIAALEMRSLIYGGIALMGTLGGIAGFFILLDSPFVALFQIAVYVGSIAVLILFTIMLVKRELIFQKERGSKTKVCRNSSYVDNNDLLGSCNIQFRSLLHNH